MQIAITPVNDPPTVTLDQPAPVGEGSPVTLTAHGADVDADALTYTWTTDVGTLTPSGPTATLVADDGPATAHVTVTADDGNGGTATAAVTSSSTTSRRPSTPARTSQRRGAFR